MFSWYSVCASKDGNDRLIVNQTNLQVIKKRRSPIINNGSDGAQPFHVSFYGFFVG